MEGTMAAILIYLRYRVVYRCNQLLTR